MEFKIKVHGEINDNLVDNVVDQLRSIYLYNKEMLETYIEPELYESVILNFNSEGGILVGFSQIEREINKLKEQGVKIIGEVDGISYSCSFLLMLLCDEITASKFSSFMYHRGLCALSYDKVDNHIDFLSHQQKILDRMDDFIISRTKITRDQLEKFKTKEWYIDYDEAIELGIIVEPKEPEIPMLTVDECVSSFVNAGYRVKEYEEELAESSELKVE
ncbi:ATP-dependent Clp protease proteolytic subunit [Terrisporobacter sp.]|uniref:ATP-dependent Clp protease proteolytic subunit n=1 Tax=Terrisporobacter sp. TaxID=1965305 RepID=UPI00289A2F7A|nr:ATP-dependent Clp protease proteolytic subunit [Terrisporobacter sp.]